jgi:hypothetical protein
MQQVTQEKNRDPLPPVFESIDRDAFLDDASRLVEEEVGVKGGVSGLAIKAAFRVAAGLQPGFPRKTLEHLFPAFARALAPVLQAKRDDQDHEALFSVRAEDVADALLSITDRRMEGATGAFHGAYRKIRGAAKRNVVEAAPRIGRLLDLHGRVMPPGGGR